MLKKDADLFEDDYNQSKKPNNEAEMLEKVISTLDTAYFGTDGADCINPLTGEVVTDNEYDAMKKRLKEIKPNSYIFKTVTAAKEKSGVNKVKHYPPMTSINKCNGTEEEKKEILKKWFKDCLNCQSIPDVSTYAVMSWKHDGIALSLNYEKGLLVSAGLRSKNGVDGEDVTDKTKYIHGIPQQLTVPISCTIRGEIETGKSVFKKINDILITSGEKEYSNPRAYSAGVMGRKTAEEIKGAGLNFVAYNILNFNNAPFKTELERAKYAKEVLKFHFADILPFELSKIKSMEEQHRNLDFLIDGLVISVNNLEDQEQLGTTGDSITANPKGKIAWKFADQIETTTVKQVIWSCGRSGNITPVLIIYPVQLEGTKVQRVTAHNVSIIKQNKIGIGSEIEVVKSGKIIPKLHKVIKAKGELNIPINCPSCGSPTEIKNGDNDTQGLICINKKNCPAQNIKNLDHWLKTIGAKGIGESTIEKLVEGNLIKKVSDFYKLTVDSIKNIGIQERSAILIVSRLKMIQNPEEKDNSVLLALLNKIKNEKITLSLRTFISALGMDGAGKSAGQLLATKYKNLHEILRLSLVELENIEGFGPITAKVIYDYLHHNTQEIENLLNYIQLENIKKEGILTGKIFVLSGELPGGKSEWKDLIENNGGTISSSVGKKVNYLVAGEGSGLKREKALELKIPIIDTEKLKEMLNQ